MKELSIEEKAKHYDEALERAKDYYKANQKLGDSDENEVLSDIFPELKESEDEKTRKWIIAYLNDEFLCADEFIKPKLQTAIAWLEKQGEQKETLCGKCKKTQPSHSCQDITALGRCAIEKQGEQKPAIDFRAEDWCVSKVDGKIHNIYNSEVGPKFKVGDWVVDNCNNLWKIVGIMNGFYILEDGDEGGSRPTIEWVDKTFHLWTIQDAKDGDVLASKNGDTILIFRNLDNNIGFSSYYNTAGMGELGWSNNRFIPATKEQRDQLEKAMTDAGYTFDFEKKKLRKIEQKPVWSEEDELLALSIEHVMNCASLLNIVPEKVDKIRTWIKSLKQRMEVKV